MFEPFPDPNPHFFSSKIEFQQFFMKSFLKQIGSIVLRKKIFQICFKGKICICVVKEADFNKKYKFWLKIYFLSDLAIKLSNPFFNIS